MGNTLPQAISVNPSGANALNADLFAAQDFSQYTQVNIQVSGTFVGTLTFQASKDWITYSTCPTYSSVGSIVTTTTWVWVFTIFPTTRFYRVRMTAYTSWAAIGSVDWYFNSTPIALITTTPVSGTVTSNTVETTLIAPTSSVITTAATTNATSIKASAWTVYNISVTNKTASSIFVKLFNKATAPTVGTDIPTIVLTIPTNSFFKTDFSRLGTRFTTWIAMSITWAFADADTTVTAAAAVIITDYI